MITFTPLSGAARSSRKTPLAYLLQVDDVRILLDCGSPDWCPEEASSSTVKEEDLAESAYHWEQYCQALKQHAPAVDLVLLSHGDLAHSGLYPYAYAHWGLTAPAYTTLPVQAMARIAAIEDVEGIRDEQDVGDNPTTDSDDQQPEGPSSRSNSVEVMNPSASITSRSRKRKFVATVQEVHEAFASVNVLRYSQPCHLQGKCQGLTIIPFNAGHTLGGTIWKIRSPTAGTLLYAVNMNHMRERHLDGTVLMRQGAGSTVFETLQRPDLLITDAERANVTTARRKDRDAALLDCINSKVPLQGAELEEYLAKERSVKEKEAAKKAAEERRQRILEADEDDTDEDSDSDSDSDDENEVERALGGDMDTSDDAKMPKDRKRNSSKATSFFKSTEGQVQRFRMFPYVEKKRRMDEYGEMVDVGMWLRRGKALEEDAETEEMKELKRQNAEEESKKTPQEPPSKFVTTEVEVQMACRLLFVDLEGLNDGRAVKTIIPQVNPRKMIIVHAPESATEHLLESCAGIRAMTKDIYAPTQGETVQIGQHTNSFSISLSDELLASLQMSKFEDNEVGYVTGRIASLASSTIPILEPITALAPPREGSRKLLRGHMLGSRPTMSLPQSTMIGELKLTALKTRLASIGVQAELVGEGVLICGAAAKRGALSDSLEDSVAVKKTARGRVELEGAVSDIYYQVRKEIYGLHALVAA
ncbi:hypothetical protein EW026_g3930 [Hermanssonia centrifuga]|uniref:Cleavage and polyadenylation specificity factor subunit 2 n=1 Tax=Hermanssonia centrifuga TaxID=98765 RepID=A0A4V3XAI1_9APHY|nr:hypothetical protein EW026_g3930 [Hermanssonia centrifuga]